jgi:hypothetical protein
MLNVVLLLVAFVFSLVAIAVAGRIEVVAVLERH